MEEQDLHPLNTLSANTENASITVIILHKTHGKSSFNIDVIFIICLQSCFSYAKASSMYTKEGRKPQSHIFCHQNEEWNCT